MCPYFAMFPESFAEYWIKKLTKPMETVLDPFSGRGTTALTALLFGRKAISSDVNDVAICLTKAKTMPPSLSRLKTRVSELKSEFDLAKWRRAAKGSDEFSIRLRAEYARAIAVSSRDIELAKVSRGQYDFRADAWIATWRSSVHTISEQSDAANDQHEAPLLGQFLEGTEPRGAPRDAFTLLVEMANFRYASPVPAGTSVVLHTDMRNLPTVIDTATSELIRCAVTSPPYLDVTSFEEDQWLRLWFLGGASYPKKGAMSRDDRAWDRGQLLVVHR